MKKLLSSVAIVATNFVFGQITLQHSFPSEELQVYTNANETFYYTAGPLTYNSNLTTIKIYNPNYTLKKQFTPVIPAGYSLVVHSEINFTLSKNVFNTDNLLEMIVLFHDDSAGNKYIIRIYNEDGVVIKDFGDGYFGEGDDVFVYHDNTSNTNKLRLYNGTTNTTEIYNLSTTSLSAKEVQSQNKLSAFPIPTNKILNVINPENGANKVQIYDTSGKLIMNKTFSSNDDKISIDVETLDKGMYFYKIGDLSSKFIKN